MEEKKTIRISISTFFLLVAIIAIGVMGFFIYKLNDDKTKATNEVEELNNQVKTLENTVNTLQEKTKNITENSTGNNSISNNDKISFTDEQVKKAASDYLELNAHGHCGTPLETLKEKGKINYDSSKDKFKVNSGVVTTNLKFSDYRNAMLNYVTENEFEKNWTDEIYLKEDSEGYLTYAQGGGGLRTYTINSISKINNNTYSVNTTSIVEDDASTKSNDDFTFTVKAYNGNCVIDSVEGL